jgi:N-acetylmuramoyl-L-alanine amidase
VSARRSRPTSRSIGLCAGVLPALLAVGWIAAAVSATAAEQEPAPAVVVVDAGHGGEDFGAVGPGGGLEKDVALAVAREVGSALRDIGIQVVYTRTSDRFVPLAERTAVANRAHGDFFLSIHSNASRDPAARGLETYFLAVEASDQDALQVAITENQVFKQVSDSRVTDVVGAILGDLAVSDTLRLSRKFAVALHHELAKLPIPSRGVKQAEFVVLSNVNMPSALLELGFLTNADEEKLLLSSSHQKAIGLAVIRALGPLLRGQEAERSLENRRGKPRPPEKVADQVEKPLPASESLNGPEQP